MPSNQETAVAVADALDRVGHAIAQLHQRIDALVAKRDATWSVVASLNAIASRIEEASHV